MDESFWVEYWSFWKTEDLGFKCEKMKSWRNLKCEDNISEDWQFKLIKSEDEHTENSLVHKSDKTAITAQINDGRLWNRGIYSLLKYSNNGDAVSLNIAQIMVI